MNRFHCFTGKLLLFLSVQMLTVNKLVTICLIGLYCFAMTKATVNFHYCCDELVSVSINKEMRCGHEKPLKDGLHAKSCCSDLKVTITSDLHVPKTSATFTENLPNFFPIQSGMIERRFLLNELTSIGIESRAGPDKCVAPKLYLLNSSFLHYG